MKSVAISELISLKNCIESFSSNPIEFDKLTRLRGYTYAPMKSELTLLFEGTAEVLISHVTPGIYEAFNEIFHRVDEHILIHAKQVRQPNRR